MLFRERAFLLLALLAAASPPPPGPARRPPLQEARHSPPPICPPAPPPFPPPQDPRVVRRCRRRVFELYEAGALQAWTDVGHGFRGVGQIADAVDYMLQGGHVGKVVVPLV